MNVEMHEKCPRCKAEEGLLRNEDNLITCKKCNPDEYWKLHQQQNPNAVGDWH